MTFKLPDLPFDRDALEPFISARTIGFHYDKHHAGYVTKLNERAAGKISRTARSRTSSCNAPETCSISQRRSGTTRSTGRA